MLFLHVAALVKMWAPDSAQFDRVNVEATENAIHAASDAGIPKSFTLLHSLRLDHPMENL